MKFVLALVAAAAFAPLLVAPVSAESGAQICKLVTRAEAAKAMGTASLPGLPKNERDGASCRYYSNDKTKNVFVQALDPAMVGQLAKMGGKAIPGVGDGAYWSYGSMFVKKGKRGLQVGLYLNAASMDKMDPGVVPLAKLATSRY